MSFMRISSIKFCHSQYKNPSVLCIEYLICWKNASYKLALLNKKIVKDVSLFSKFRNYVIIDQ